MLSVFGKNPEKAGATAGFSLVFLLLAKFIFAKMKIEIEDQRDFKRN